MKKNPLYLKEKYLSLLFSQKSKKEFVLKISIYILILDWEFEILN
jgi:hypothetical protein